MTKQELFCKKGELEFTIQVAQGELQQVNQALLALVKQERQPKIESKTE